MKLTNTKNFFSTLFNSYADIFFIRCSGCGAVILLLNFLNYNAAISGLFSIFAAYLTALLLGYQSEFLRSGFFTYNALLSGLAIGVLFKLSLPSLLMIAIAGSLTLILTLVSANVFYYLFGLQILSVPFILVSTLVYLSASSYSNLYVTSLYVPVFYLNLDFLPFWLSGYFKSLGAIIFMPNDITGLVIAALLLFYSRILFLLSFTGFIFGITLFGYFTGSIQSAAADVSNFNYILIAMAIGGVFNIPCVKSYLLAMLGVAMATLISSAGHIFWSQYGLPVFTLPFTLVTLSFIYTLKITNYPWVTQVYKGSPEENLEHFISNQHRYVNEPIVLSLPFMGQWYSWQGFNGKWTHQGLNQYAHDFVMVDSSKQTYMNQGKVLSDYYCYLKEVTSPVNGRVVSIENTKVDNIIGSIDSINYWGNYILIEDREGHFIKIAHLSHQSISVFEGQEVSVGMLLGLCGNSGNSPQPHIHIQVQSSYFDTAPTLPFIFVNYEQQEQYIPSGLPIVDEVVSHCHFDYFADQLTNFVLDDEYLYQVSYQQKKIATLKLTVRMSDTLYTYFETDKAQLFFGKQYGNFYMYNMQGQDPFLKLFFLALSTMPVSYKKGLQWQDTVNNALILNKWQQMLSSILNAFYTGWVSSYSHYQYQSETLIRGQIKNKLFAINLATSIQLDSHKKIKSITVGDYQLEQINFLADKK